MTSASESRNGFSLLELLVVVAIVLIIATLAMPSFLRSRQAALETGAVSNLRLINGAQTTYHSTHEFFGAIGSLSAAGLMDDRFSSDPSVVGGFTFYMYGAGTDDYTVSALANGLSGRYNYYTGSDSVIRFRDATPGEFLPNGKSPGDPVG